MTINKQFPTGGLLPKDATEASIFLKKYPRYDGEGVVIAILDTGVDPGAPGLQTTTRDQVKVIDIVDCTGSGDVVMSKPVKPSADTASIVSPFTGRTLFNIPNSGIWKNTLGEYRIGSKRAFEIFPASLVASMTQKRKEKFLVEHNKLLAQVKTEFSAFEKEIGGTPKTEQDQEKKADFEARIECLTKAMKDYDDVGPVYDCLLFKDTNDRFVAAIDTTETGDFKNAVLLSDYRIDQKYSCFGTDEMLNYSIKIYDDGDILSIVTLAGSHGTHVAAIAAANYPNDPALNGIAPGAKIVSLKIGDTRLGSMETGTGLTRALNSIIENGCDICNMSYGEACGVANAGRWIELLRDELIDKRRVIFVSSAGNAGPALSTAGAPGATTSGVIGVGAYVTPEMIEAEYALLEQVPDRPFTWSSQPPAYDGANGVVIYAPGAAITSVPQYLLKNTQLMNGTSMSSPNACGNLALLISAMKDLGYPFSTHRFIKALQNTGKDIKDPFKIGFMQIDKTFDYLCKYRSDFSLDIDFDVSITKSGGNGSVSRGIYLREVHEVGAVYHASVTVTPKFRRDDPSENPKKLAYEDRLVLIPTSSFVQAPEFLLMNSGGRDFQIRVDPTKLAPGLHYAQVEAFVFNQIDKGPIFRIPITVLVPDRLESNKISFSHKFNPGEIHRHFISVPKGCTWIDIAIKSNSSQGETRNPGRLVVHALQMLPHLRHNKTEQEWYFNMNGKDPIPKKSFKVYGGVTLELCLAQFWSSIGQNEIQVELELHGVSLVDRSNVLDGSKIYERLDLTCAVGQEIISPSLSFDHLRKILRPTSSAISPLKSRDVMINSKTNSELILNYTLNVTESSTVTVMKPCLDDILYDSPLDSVLFMIHDAHKKMVSFGDVYPKATKLEKGEYTIRVQLRHDSIETLEKLKNTPIHVDFKVNAVSAPLFLDQQSIFHADKKKPVGKQVRLDQNSRYVLYAPGSLESLPKEAKFGDYLVGELGFQTGSGSIEILYLVPPAESKPEEKKPSAPEPTLNEVIRDSKLGYLAKVTKKEEKKPILEELVKSWPNHVPVLISQLEFTATSESETEIDRANNYEKIITHSNVVLDNLKESEILSFLSLKAPAIQTDEYKLKKKEMEENKKNLVLAKYRRAEALMCVLTQKDATDQIMKQFEESFRSLQPLAELSEARIVLLFVAREYLNKRYGSALKIVNTFISENLNSTTNTTGISSFLKGSQAKNDIQKALEWRLLLLKSLHWLCWERLEKQSQLVRFPLDFATF